MKFTKMHGIGNDYIYINCFNQSIANPQLLAKKLSNRNFGIGSDGLILILPPQNIEADARMRMFNADGSEAEMCGNGIRCLAKYIYDHNIVKKNNIIVETKNGNLHLKLFIKNEKAFKIKVNMGKPVFEGFKIPTTIDKIKIIEEPLEILDRKFKFTAISMGNPHCIIYIDNVTDFPIEKYGKIIETHPYFPHRVNVEFVEILKKNEVIQRTWERGSGETLACGTGASAVGVAGVLTGKTANKITNHLSGGDLEIEWDGNETNPVYMTGPAIEVFNGEINIKDII